MGKFGGFGGGMGNMQQLMKQAQKMQQDMLAAQEELANTEVVGKSGGSMVEVTMTCDKKLVGISIKPEAVDPDDVEMLEDLVVAAFNDALTQADAIKEEKMGAFGNIGL
ncbi:MAG: YbaB/EbfC family nucleoid-associated protein [Christensenellales bacterium]